MSDPFSRDLVQAINDWQRGGDHKTKVRRGERLKEAMTVLPVEFRECDVPCFRQEAHDKSRTFGVLIANKLPETIAAWTTDVGIAKDFKGGVPPSELRGVILRIVPPPGTVVANLQRLYADPDFLAAVETHSTKVDNFSVGAGRYMGTQKEVVLELGSIDAASIFSYGGYASGLEELQRAFETEFRRSPTPSEADHIAAMAARAWWLSEDGTWNAIERTIPKFLDRVHRQGAAGSPGTQAATGASAAER